MTARFTTNQLRTQVSPKADEVVWLDEPARAGTAAAVRAVASDEVGSVATVAPTKVAELFVPDHYEKNYAYPLIVWLGTELSPSGGIRSLMRRISDRNIVGASVHPAADERIEDRLVSAIASVRKQYHIHSERIFLAGVGEYAAQALRLGLARPEWFGGVIAISPQLTKQKRMLSQFPALQGKRVFLATTGDDPEELGNLLGTQRLLWSAGMSVRACQSASGEELDRGILREIDRWVIESIVESG